MSQRALSSLRLLLLSVRETCAKSEPHKLQLELRFNIRLFQITFMDAHDEEDYGEK
jgi:hypothetical protein